jgi:hypothetical protein
LPQDETRATFIVNKAQLAFLKAIAEGEGVLIREAIEEALALYVNKKMNKGALNVSAKR